RCTCGRDRADATVGTDERARRASARAAHQPRGLNIMRGEGTVTLADGRAIGYAEYGVADGIPIFEFHGLPGSRHYSLRADALEAAGARLVTLERPGFGLSDPKPGRTLLDWPNDVAEVANHFGFDRFAVLGYSAGGPNAIATGYVLPDRVAVVG